MVWGQAWVAALLIGQKDIRTVDYWLSDPTPQNADEQVRAMLSRLSAKSKPREGADG